MMESDKKAALILFVLFPSFLLAALPTYAQQARTFTSKAKIAVLSPVERPKPLHSENSSSGEDESISSAALDLRITQTIDGALAQQIPDSQPKQPSSKPEWHYGGFVDAGYLLDFNHPANRIFRSGGTTWHVDYPHLNMAGSYLRKKASEKSRWGVELTAQAGKDSEVFGFSATAPNIGGFKVLRHLGPTNVSYVAAIGSGLALQGGIFNSLIGYDSLYAKDNFEYTRPWGADFTPYFMMGPMPAIHSTRN